MGAILLIDNTISFSEIKKSLQCTSKHCCYTRSIAYANSKYYYAFRYDCNKMGTLFYKLDLTNEIPSSKVSMSLQYIIIISIVLISLCMLIISIKNASKSNMNNAPLIENIK